MEKPTLNFQRRINVQKRKKKVNLNEEKKVEAMRWKRMITTFGFDPYSWLKCGTWECRDFSTSSDKYGFGIDFFSFLFSRFCLQSCLCLVVLQSITQCSQRELNAFITVAKPFHNLVLLSTSILSRITKRRINFYSKNWKFMLLDKSATSIERERKTTRARKKNHLVQIMMVENKCNFN